MIFASIEFIIFFICVLSAAFIIQKYCSFEYKKYFLLAASYFFYGWWDWRFCFLLLFVTVTSYSAEKKNNNKAAYIIGIAAPLVVLGFFKYFNFFLNSLSAISGRDLGTLKIILPVGISFYTFQALSYVIDVKRGKLKAANSFADLALYLSFFPQLVAGPIVRAADFMPQLVPERKISAENIKYGIQLCAMGFFKKIVLADHLSVFVDDVFNIPIAFHWTSIILAAVSYSLQIYFDFSGYSDIAIGCAKCMGYDFKRNFNLPYISQSVTEFWRRWHISLSTWLKEYLYIPLGGNRRGEARRLINIFITMLLGGLWHGANWTFAAWGGINGLALCCDKFFKLNSNNQNNKFIKFIKIIFTFAFITFTWIFFRAENFSKAWAVIKGIFTMQDGIIQPFFWSFFALIIFIAASLFAFLKSLNNNNEISGCYLIFNLDKVTGLTAFFVFIGLIIGLAFTGENPFIYFQF